MILGRLPDYSKPKRYFGKAATDYAIVADGIFTLISVHTFNLVRSLGSWVRSADARRVTIGRGWTT